VGAANSAGQAAVFLSQTSEQGVNMVVRAADLAESMSQISTQRIIGIRPSSCLHSELTGLAARTTSKK